MVRFGDCNLAMTFDMISSKVTHLVKSEMFWACNLTVDLSPTQRAPKDPDYPSSIIASNSLPLQNCLVFAYLY